MIGRIATLIGYRKAPKATFMVKHPVKGAKAYVAYKGLTNPTTLGIAAALVAVPAAAAWYLGSR